ncbi:glutaredoxin 3 [Luteimonas yindakuii]|uniref:glutaredoxin 3 n=1 Tax=Luteimonas yindakuii TaxID=2565782 RepID=UPI003CCDD9EE
MEKPGARAHTVTILAPASFPESDVSSPEITLYTSAMCGYCVAAKTFLKSKGLEWTEVRIDLDPDARQRMVETTRRTSVPQIFIGQTHVGGYDDMMALHRAGKLEPLLGGETS